MCILKDHTGFTKIQLTNIIWQNDFLFGLEKRIEKRI